MLELLQKRRTIRKYKTKKVEKKTLEYILKCALLAPSSHSVCPWNFLLVDDPKKIEKLSTAKLHGSQFMKNAPAAVVITADSTKTDVWVEDCSIAATLIQVAAESQGVGSCWIQIRKRMHDDNLSSEEFIKNMFDLPENTVVEAIIALGYKNEERPDHDMTNLKYNQVFYNDIENNFF